MANIVNNLGQVLVGFRSPVVAAPVTSSLLTSLFGVWNGETTTTTLATGAFGAWNGEGSVTATQLQTNAFGAWNAEKLGTSLDVSIKGYWNGENVTTDLVSGNNGTLMSGATYSSGKIGNAFSFNGSNSYMKLPDNSLNYTGDFSISCWVNVSGIGSWGQYIYAVSNLQTSGSNYYGWRLFIYGNAYAFDICNGTSTISGYQSASVNGVYYNCAGDYSTQIAPVTGGAWKHVVITRKAGTATKMYVNGVLKNSNISTVDPVYATTHNPAIGAQITNGGNSFGGSTSGVDLISTWNKELSQDDVLSLYNNSSATEYPYSTKTLPSAGDAISTNNGTLMNGCVYTSSGKIGNAFTFDGINDYISLPTNSINFGNDFTVSAWVYLTTTSRQDIMTNYYWNGGNQYGWWLIHNSSGQIQFSYVNSSQQEKDTTYSFTGKYNSWNHILVTKIWGGITNLYVNGVLVSTNSDTTNPIYTTTHYPAMGAMQYNSSSFQAYFANGSKLDAVSTWTRVLTSDEALGLYNSGNGQQYPFSNVSVSTPSDSVGTNNGTVVGGVTYSTGIVGNAFSFDGATSYVDISNNNLKLYTFSVSTWVYIPTASYSNTQCIFYNGYYDYGSTGTYYGFYIAVGTNNTLVCRALNGTTDNTVNTLSTSLTGLFGSWIHITYTKLSATNAKLYINGSLVSSNTTTTEIVYNTTHKSAIGILLDSVKEYPMRSGSKIDSTTIWNKQLTDDEVTQLYNLGGGIQYPFTTQTIKTPYAVYNGDNLVDPIGAKNATINGGVTYTTGKIGNAYTFDGTTGYLTLPVGALNFQGTSFSFSMWLNFNGTPANYATIISNCLIGSYKGFILAIISGNLYIEVGNGTGTWPQLQGPAVTEFTNKWGHITFVWEQGVGLKFYLNGVLYNSSANTTTPDFTTITAAPMIGKKVDGGWALLNGSIDGLTFWNSALTYPEISTLYNAGNGMEYPYASNITAQLPSASDVYGSNNGTLMNGCTFTTGKIGKAFTFDGVNDYVALPTNSFNSLTGDFSISFWMKLNDSQPNFGTLFSNLQYNGVLYWGWQVMFYSGQIHFTVGTNNTSTSRLVSNALTNYIGNWVHVVCTHKASTGYKIYVNNTLNNSNSDTYNPSYTATHTPSIGAQVVSTIPLAYPLNGLLDAVSVWNKELTSTEVTTLYNSGSGKQYPNY